MVGGRAILPSGSRKDDQGCVCRIRLVVKKKIDISLSVHGDNLEGHEDGIGILRALKTQNTAAIAIVRYRMMEFK